MAAQWAGWALAVVYLALVLLPQEAAATEVEQLLESPSDETASRYYNQIPGFSLTQGAKVRAGVTSNAECEKKCSLDATCKSYSFRAGTNADKSDSECATSDSKVEYDMNYDLYVKAQLSEKDGKFRSFKGLVYRSSGYLECDNCSADCKCGADKEVKCGSLDACRCQCKALDACRSFSYRKVSADQESKCMLSGKGISYSPGFSYYEKKGVVSTTSTGAQASDVDGGQPKVSKAKQEALKALMDAEKLRYEQAKAEEAKAKKGEAQAQQSVSAALSKGRSDIAAANSEAKQKTAEEEAKIKKGEQEKVVKAAKKISAVEAANLKKTQLELAEASIKQKAEAGERQQAEAVKRAAADAAEATEKEKKTEAEAQKNADAVAKNAAAAALATSEERAINQKKLDAKKLKAAAELEEQKAKETEVTAARNERLAIEAAEEKAAQEKKLEQNNAAAQQEEEQKQVTKVEADSAREQQEERKRIAAQTEKKDALRAVQAGESEKLEAKRAAEQAQQDAKQRANDEKAQNKAGDEAAAAKRALSKAQSDEIQQQEISRLEVQARENKAQQEKAAVQLRTKQEEGKIKQDEMVQKSQLEFEANKQEEVTNRAAQLTADAAQEDKEEALKKSQQAAKEAAVKAKVEADRKQKLLVEQEKARVEKANEKLQKDKEKSAEEKAKEEKELKDQEAKDKQEAKAKQDAADKEMALKAEQEKQLLAKKTATLNKLAAEKLAKKKKDAENVSKMQTILAVDSTFVDSGTPVGKLDMAELDADVVKANLKLEAAKKAAEIANGTVISWEKKRTKAELRAAETKAVAGENGQSMKDAAHQNMTAALVASQQASIKLRAAEAGRDLNNTAVANAEKTLAAAKAKLEDAQASLGPSNTACGVKSCSGASAPSKGLLKLLSSAKREKSAFLKFDVGDLAGSDQIIGATLRVYKTSGGEGPLVVKTVACSWSKQELTYTNSSMFSAQADIISRGATLPTLSETWVDVVLDKKKLNKIKNQIDSKICLRLSGGSSETEDVLASEQYTDASKHPQLRLSIKPKAPGQQGKKPQMAESAQAEQLKREFEQKKRSELQSKFTQQLLSSNKEQHQLKEARAQEECDKKISDETTGTAKAAIEAEAKASSDAAVDEKIQKHREQLQQKATAEMQSKVAEAGVEAGSPAAEKLKADLQSQSSASVTRQVATFEEQAKRDAQNAVKQQVTTVLQQRKTKIETQCKEAKIERQNSAKLDLSAPQKLKVMGMVEKALPGEMVNFKVDEEGNVINENVLDSAKEIGEHHTTDDVEELDEFEYIMEQ